MKKGKRNFRIINADTPDEIIWEEFWKNKSPQEKLDAAEQLRTKIFSVGGKKRVAQRLQRIFRVAERT